MDDLVSATTAFVAYLEDLPQDVPVAEVRAQAQAQVAQVANARLSLGVTVCKQPAPPTAAPAASVASAASEVVVSPTAP